MLGLLHPYAVLLHGRNVALTLLAPVGCTGETLLLLLRVVTPLLQLGCLGMELFVLLLGGPGLELILPG